MWMRQHSDVFQNGAVSDRNRTAVGAVNVPRRERVVVLERVDDVGPPLVEKSKCRACSGVEYDDVQG